MVILPYMTQSATITSKRQLTLPSKLFKKAKLKIGQKVLISEDDGRLIITPSENLVEELAGSLSLPAKWRNKDTETIIEESKSEYFRSFKK